MKKLDIFKSNLAVLSKAHLEDLENEFIISGVIDKFFIQFELAWKVLKDEFIDEDIWLSMLRERNNMTYIYDGNAAKELVKKIISQYIPAFCLMKEEIESRYRPNGGGLKTNRG